MKALVLDTETTGLISNHSITLDQQPEVIEFYAAFTDLRTGKILRDYHTLVKPRKYPMTQQILEETKTKLDNAMLANAPSFADVSKRIKGLIESSAVVIAHNCSFDKEMLDIEFERLGDKLHWPRLICTVEQSAHLRGRRLTLMDLHRHFFNKDFDEAHRAKPDTMALIKCARAMWKDGLL